MGFVANSDFFVNHPLSGTPLLKTLACQNMEYGVEWSNLVYQISLPASALQQKQAECLSRYMEDQELFPSLPVQLFLSESPPCPCSLFQAFLDLRYWLFFAFDFNFICAIRTFSSNSINHRCCYSISFDQFG